MKLFSKMMHLSSFFFFSFIFDTFKKSHLQVFLFNHGGDKLLLKSKIKEIHLLYNSRNRNVKQNIKYCKVCNKNCKNWQKWKGFKTSMGFA